MQLQNLYNLFNINTSKKVNIRKEQIIINNICINITYKKIKNINLRICPPDGEVRITAPLKANIEKIKSFAASKLQWIIKHQEKLKQQPHIKPFDYITGETHYLFGNKYQLNVIEHSGQFKVILNNEHINLYVRKGMQTALKQAIMTEWYREQLKRILPELFDKWQEITGITINEWNIKRMKTRWGTCCIKAKRIWVNLEFAKKSMNCIEYLIVHELTHLLERGHGTKFKSYMNKFLPNWKQYKAELNKSHLIDRNSEGL